MRWQFAPLAHARGVIRECEHCASALLGNYLELRPSLENEGAQRFGPLAEGTVGPLDPGEMAGGHADPLFLLRCDRVGFRYRAAAANDLLGKGGANVVAFGA